MKLFKRISKRALHLMAFLSGEGSWQLKPGEKDILNAALVFLDRDVSQLVRQQLTHDFFVDRMADGRIVVFRYYDADPLLTVPGDKWQDALIRIHFQSGGTTHKAHAVLYQGYFFGIELPAPACSFAHTSLQVLEVEFGDPNESYTFEIDRFEHPYENLDGQ